MEHLARRYITEGILYSQCYWWLNGRELGWEKKKKRKERRDDILFSKGRALTRFAVRGSEPGQIRFRYGFGS